MPEPSLEGDVGGSGRGTGSLLLVLELLGSRLNRHTKSKVR